MESTQSNTLFRSAPNGLVNVLISVCVLAGVMAIAIAWRVSHRSTAPAILPVLGWQLLVWMPWAVYYYAVRYFVRRFGSYQDASAAGLLQHVFAALLIAASHLAWFWHISDFMSPFREMPGTRYGAYPFFFVFWFLFDLLIYWAVLARPYRLEEPDAPVAAARFAVTKGRTKHLVRAKDIRWIEAQGYYAALHTNSGSFLLRKSLTSLENELDPERFIRVHRSTIVNIDDIRALRSNDNGSCSVMLADGTDRSVSRAGRRKLRPFLQESS